MPRPYLIRTILAFSLLVQGAAAYAQAVTTPAAGPDAAARWGMLDTFCTECHNSTDWAGGIAFDTLTPADVPHDVKLWEGAVRKLRGHLMPPPGNKQPTQAQKDAMVGWLETSLDARAETPRAGHVPVQRLNRTEYANTVRSLLGVEIKVQDLLPPEIEMDGFDNIAAALQTSPAFLDQYLSAARFIAKQAVGSPAPKLSKTLYPVGGVPQDNYIDGMPLGSRGGVSFRHNFVADGEYHISILDLDIGLYPSAAEWQQTVVMYVDGKEAFRGDVGGPEDLALVDREGADGRAKIIQRFSNIPVKVQAGTRDVVVTFIERARALSDEYLGGIGGQNGGDFGGFGRLQLARLLNGVEVSGPYGPVTLQDTASRDRIFVCHPQSMADEEPCARRIAENLTRRAYRRPVNTADVDHLMPFFTAGRKEAGNFDGGVEQLVAGVLASPDYLYRSIAPPADSAPGDIYVLSNLELASRLSFFLWSDGPDDELLSVAASGKLSDPKVYEAQVRRMLVDPKASALVTGFAMRWLNVDDLKAVEPDPRLFPNFDDRMRKDFSTEIELFLRSVLLEDKSIKLLLSADYSFLNERMARLYGIDNVFGPQFRRVTLTDPNRFGLLGKSAVLLRTSYANRTSPVLRGAWVMERIMGTPPTQPPPGVSTNLDVPAGQKVTTVRARLELHRAAKSCSQCHGVIDPIGLAMENFDVIGAWREHDAAADAPIDASTVLPSGVPVNGPVELRNQLLSRPEQFALAFSQKLMMYGLGREVQPNDLKQIRALVHAAAKSDYRFSDIVLGVVTSDAFRMQALTETKPAESRQGEGKPPPAKVAAVR
jgi:mono/diheme cytochrome c family protein